MPEFSLTANTYGKDEVRLVRVVRGSARHVLRDVTARIRLLGDFDAVYTHGDNTGIPATDTMKNSVFALAKDHFTTGSLEDFASVLAEHWLQRPRVDGVHVELVEHPWARLGEHDHAFERTASGTHLAWVDGDAGGLRVRSGLGELYVLRSTGSSFEGFERDGFTTLAETDDRILATVISAQWTYAPGSELDYAAAWSDAKAAILNRFADHHSPSVQMSLHRMASGVLEAVPAATECSIELPNRHHLLVDLAPMGKRNPNEVFVATRDPYGVISGTVSRS